MAQFLAPLSFNWPLSGDVTQGFDWSGARFGLINIDLGFSNAPEVEREALRRVGSYGRQLGQIADALEVVLAHVKIEPKSEHEKDVLAAFRLLQDTIADIKREHSRG